MTITYDTDGVPIVSTKHPDSVLDYLFDWSDWLNELGDGDTIDVDAATITAERGITIDSYANDDLTAGCWISGGSSGNVYLIECEIVTVNGRTAYWRFKLPVGYVQDIPTGI